ncbi:MAG: head-tail adaptor protein [Anaerolineaceae bacterium]|nr:MAG: head-tail adaptor protein [Anaerolineaceae bacterium]
MPTAGELDCRFTFQKRQTTAGDGYGNFQADWQTQFTVWTKRIFVRGGEQVIAARLEGRQPGVLTVRASPDTRLISTDWRAVNAEDATEIWNIRSVQPGVDRDEIEFLVERGVASG